MSSSYASPFISQKEKQREGNFKAEMEKSKVTLRKER